jgi:hypothetical protein
MDDIWGYTPMRSGPFPALSYQIAAALGPGSPWPNHAINIAVHAINAGARVPDRRDRRGLRRGAAALAGVLFAVFPIQAESVAWITGRVDSLPAAFYFALVTSICNLAARRAPVGVRLVGGVLLRGFVLEAERHHSRAGTLVAFDLIQGSKVRGFEGSKVRRFEGSKVRRFEGSRVREVWKLDWNPTLRT